MILYCVILVSVRAAVSNGQHLITSVLAILIVQNIYIAEAVVTP